MSYAPATHRDGFRPDGSLTPELGARLANVRHVITDFDGTMLTGAKALVNSSGAPSASLVEVLVDLARAGIDVIPCSGRNRSMTLEDARLLNLPGWIAEMGGILCTRQGSNPEWCYYTADMPYTEGGLKTPHDLICETGVIDEILEAHPGHIETYHDNYVGYEYREVTVALRGDVPAAQIQATLDQASLPLYLSDNGYVRRISGETTLDCDLDHPKGVHTYHVMPRGLTKGTGIKRFLEIRGWDADECLALGDSPADCEMADAVGTFMFMSNGLDHPAALTEIAARDNIYLSQLPATDGFVQAMQALLDVQA